ncbi:WW domain-containing protein C11B10.08 [Ziziphus jujuba]|uniref:WW domain-containing protein C11B10.08 n=2 Tax=Ziziphus jujuba TaxID=326968 RepID=A0A6P4ADI5_ZIZJJ|nr:WW domain-containing protein C11B10.08 [Ziziphus jujuba]KAH7536701.1 hypothetical protein FEM48_Zijuj03G0014300 [Ziziphus jujuba var. spinosa]
MASGYQVEVKLSSAKDLKNVNWRNGALRPYAVLWVDPNNKCSTRVDGEGDTCPVWDETLLISLAPGPIDGDSTLYIDIVHAGSEPDTKPLIGSASLPLREVIDDVGLAEFANRTLKLKRPSGRPQGKLDVRVSVREPYHRASHSHEPYYNARVPQHYPGAPPAYDDPYAARPHDPYYSVAPPAGCASYNAPPAYGDQQVYYGHKGEEKEKKKSKFGGMGTGLAVGAAAGLLGGLALSEGFDYMEDKIANDVDERVEDDLEDDDHHHNHDDDDGGDDE